MMQLKTDPKHCAGTIRIVGGPLLAQVNGNGDGDGMSEDERNTTAQKLVDGWNSIITVSKVVQEYDNTEYMVKWNETNIALITIQRHCNGSGQRTSVQYDTGLSNTLKDLVHQIEKSI